MLSVRVDRSNSFDREALLRDAEATGINGDFRRVRRALVHYVSMIIKQYGNVRRRRDVVSSLHFCLLERGRERAREYNSAFVAFRLVYICHRTTRKVCTYSRIGSKNGRTKGTGHGECSAKNA